jgi:tRNA-splicing ligase RtcB
METISPKLLNWASILDDKTREQAVMTASLPFIYPHLALMPDAHLGKGATVGSVIPTLRTIIPAAVGVDIGCGMIAVRTQYSVRELPKDRKSLREAIERVIPLSAGHNNKQVLPTAEPRIADLKQRATKAGFNPAQYVA